MTLPFSVEQIICLSKKYTFKMLQILLFILLFNQGCPQNQPVHDEWKYCQLFFENKLTKTSFETCDVCFMPLTYYKSIGRSLTKSQYRPVSLEDFTSPPLWFFPSPGSTFNSIKVFCFSLMGRNKRKLTRGSSNLRLNNFRLTKKLFCY